MKKIPLTLLAASASLLFACLCAAQPLTVHLAPLDVVGAPDAGRLSLSLSRMLASRLAAGTPLLDSREQAQVLVEGSYTQSGEAFSFDLLLSRKGAAALRPISEQGEAPGDLLPAVGRLARTLDRELARLGRDEAAPLPAAAVAPAPRAPALPVVAGTLSPEAPQTHEFPLEGVFRGMALGRGKSGGAREIFLTDAHTLRWYEYRDSLKLVAETAVPFPATVAAVDTADLDRDGVPEIYLTVLDRGSFSSQVFLPQDGKLVRIAERLPWGFRGAGASLASRVIHVQALEREGELSPRIAVLMKTSAGFAPQPASALPSGGSVYNFVRLSGGECLVLNGEGHPVVSGGDGRVIWRGENVLGGSETLLVSREESSGRPEPGTWTYMEQRMLLLPDGTLLVPRNEGNFNFGNNRSYDRHTMYAYRWTGSRLEERWHSALTQGYLADFAFDAETGEVLMLEVTRKSGLAGAGRSVVSFRRVD